MLTIHSKTKGDKFFHLYLFSHFSTWKTSTINKILRTKNKTKQKPGQSTFYEWLLCDMHCEGFSM